MSLLTWEIEYSNKLKKQQKKESRWKKLHTKALNRDGRVCQNCGTRAKLGAHHIIPRYAGGKDVIDNLRTLCEHCHDIIECGIETALVGVWALVVATRKLLILRGPILRINLIVKGCL